MENLKLGSETRAVVDRIEHVHIAVGDLERSINFYHRIFGFKVRYDDIGPYGRCVHIGTDRFYIAMTEKPGLGKSLSNSKSTTAVIYHFGFTTDDINNFKARLRDANVKIIEDSLRKEGGAVYILDPDGHEIEVVSYQNDYIYR